MKLTFVSNYINHHQIPLSNELFKELGENYHFIQTEPMEEERVQMGWGQELSQLPYLLCYYEKPEECKKLILESDVVVFGGVEDESYIAERLESGSFTIRCGERIYKEGQWKRISPRGLIKKYKDHIRYRSKEVYMLCAGGYVADDFRLIGAYPDKMLKWGYFTEKYTYDIDDLLRRKEENPHPVILWTGRMLPLKHPEYALMLARNLVNKGYDFELRYIGDGEKKEELKNMVKELELEDRVSFQDFMKPHEVRREMERADIYLMTSNRIEGWGAVVNESMNSGCVVVASHIVGSVPTLIKDGKNGLIYKAHDIASLTEEVEKVINNKCYRKEIAKNAYETIDTLWNPQVAASRLLEFCETKDVNTYKEGPCAKDIPIREPKMYKWLKDL